MSEMLSKKLGEMEYDGLVTDIIPETEVRGKTIRRLSEETKLKRGTILSKSKSDGKLVMLGSDISEGTFSATGDGSTTKYSLIDDGIIPVGVSEVKVNGSIVTSGYMYNQASGDLVFDTAPENTKAIAVKTVICDSVPDCILCDDVTVGTSDDVIATVYTAGCFNTDKVIVKSGYTITAADYDTLRKYGIVFKAASKAN